MWFVVCVADIDISVFIGRDISIFIAMSYDVVY